jgi:flavin-binding protein dodecin
VRFGTFFLGTGKTARWCNDIFVALKRTGTDRLSSNDEAGTAAPFNGKQEEAMADSVYKIIELVGTSTESWEKAAKAAVERASKSLRDLRIAEVSQLDMHISNGKVESYRAKVKVSFKYEGEG